MKILVVEDHRKINQLLTNFLKQDKHSVKQAFSAEEALEYLHKTSFDIVITDLMLPKMQGDQMIQMIRSASDIYIMVISAKTEMDDKIDVLTIGADDYLTKPFSVEEVLIKINNLAKRIDLKKPMFYSFFEGSLKIFPLSRKVIIADKEVVLTPHEFDLLHYLASHSGRVFSRDELIERLFSDSDAFDRVIDVFIKNIRKKLLDDSKRPKYINTVHGIGYQFVGDKDD